MKFIFDPRFIDVLSWGRPVVNIFFGYSFCLFTNFGKVEIDVVGLPLNRPIFADGALRVGILCYRKNSQACITLIAFASRSLATGTCSAHISISKRFLAIFTIEFRVSLFENVTVFIAVIENFMSDSLIN